MTAVSHCVIVTYVVMFAVLRVYLCICTCVVVLGAVSEVRLIFQKELWECEALCYLDRTVLLPLKDQVVHCVTN